MASPVLKEWFSKIDSDLALLMGCFREVLVEQGDGALAAALPWQDGASAAHAGPAAPEGGPLDRELQVLSIAFQLLNLAEENAAAQARRMRESEGLAMQEPGLWGQNLLRLKQFGIGEADIRNELRNIYVEVVLTAHPTEAKRPIVLKQHRALSEALERLENSIWTDRERENIRQRIKVILERLWRIGEMHLAKPDVGSELQHVLDFFRAVFPQVLSELDERLRYAWKQAGFDPYHLRSADALPKLRFGNWVGGDRDGHPLVTADTTRNTLGLLRETALEGHLATLKTLYDDLSLTDLLQPAPGFLRTAIAETARLVGTPAEDILARSPSEPWRQFIGLMILRIDPAARDLPYAYARPEEMAADIDVLRRSLVQVGASRLVHAQIEPLARALETFGFHTAALDIRQNSDFHDRALMQLLAVAGIAETDFIDWDEPRRQEFLNAELRVPRPFAPRGADLGTEARAAVDCLQVVAGHIHRFGHEGIGSYIVSMTRDVSDLLAVYALAREAGLLRPAPEGLASDITVVPLFETVEDLEASPRILAGFLDHPITRATLARQTRPRPVQQIMVGYSDSNKGSGIFASHWHLNRAQQELVRVADERGVDLMFFHGRGGTFSRGAGPTHRFLDSLPHGSLSGAFRLTEQGETVAQKYGNAQTARYNLELLLAGVTAITLKHRLPHDDDPAFIAVGDRLTELSRDAYRDLIGSEGFLNFWAEATPIDALEQSFIGSRPARRTGKRSMEDLRAIPWVFSWIQSRYYLPGWFGVGYALEQLREKHPEQFGLLTAKANEWTFFRYVFFNAETSLASADLDLMREYAGLVTDPTLRDAYYDRIAAEYRRTESMINEVFGAPRDLRRPRMLKTLKTREEGLRFLHRRQIELLRQWRALRADGADEAADKLFPSILLSVNAIASGQRTTG